MGYWFTKGFLHGRLMLSDIVDVGFCAMNVGLNHPSGAIVLFDFAAAFTCISQDYMCQALSHIVLSSPVLGAIQRFSCNRHVAIEESCPVLLRQVM